ncbi:hypothetical protein ACIBEJ_34425 [Nonomuraea sp. NPDC050790]|uniref:hypothetical protein n=1 Tax=Nonomuraea sp. NPDC050790 TaxID=3364371 RepID=UPI0037982EF2
MEERCDLTELIKSMCAHCRGIPDEPALNPLGRRPAVSASWPGWCAACGQPFGQDDMIRSDGIGGWVAECCAGDDR